MGRYFNSILDYLPATFAAVAGFSSLALGAGHELSDLLNIEPEMSRMGMDILVSQAALLSAGTIGEAVKRVAYDNSAHENYS